VLCGTAHRHIHFVSFHSKGVLEAAGGRSKGATDILITKHLTKKDKWLPDGVRQLNMTGASSAKMQNFIRGVKMAG